MVIKRTIQKVRDNGILTQRRAKIAYKPTREEVEARIRQKAYDLFEQRGCVHGHDWEDWIEAEKIVAKELSKQ